MNNCISNEHTSKAGYIQVEAFAEHLIEAGFSPTFVMEESYKYAQAIFGTDKNPGPMILATQLMPDLARRMQAHINALQAVIHAYRDLALDMYSEDGFIDDSIEKQLQSADQALQQLGMTVIMPQKTERYRDFVSHTGSWQQTKAKQHG